jgi:WD40 repeat protein/serine/threonine protein kinase
MKKLIGATIEQYQILVKIRETPTRILYKAYSTRSQTYVALEVVKTAWLNPDELLGQINEHVRTISDLLHPNIATVIDTGLHDGLIYIVYNFSPVRPLRRFFNRTYPWKEMARELVSISHALAYAHEQDVVHGALHPYSIILDSKGNPILFDFGLERLITYYILARSPGAWINRWGFEYRAPEQLNDAAPDKQADIYSLGIMLHEWLIGKIPQLDATILGTLQRRKSTPKFIKKEVASVPPVIQNLIKKCIAVDPAERYQSMQEVYIVLARGALDMSITKKMVRKPLAIPARRFKLQRSHIRLASFAVILGILGLTAYLNRPAIYATIYPPTGTPTLTQIPPTPTQTVPPTSTPIPTATAIPPTATPLVFPVFQEVSISREIDQTLSPGNVDKMIMLSMWGIGNVNRLASAPEGNQLAGASSIGIFVFDAQSLKLEKYIDTRSSITALAFSPDGKLAATGDSDGLIQIWNTQTWEESEAPYSGHLGTILDMAFSPDGGSLASVDTDSILIQWQVNSKEGPQPKRVEVIGGATSLAYSGDGTTIVTGGNDLLINIWNAETLTLQQKKPFSGKIVDIASVKGFDRLFVVGGNDQRVALLDSAGDTAPETVGSLRYPLTSVAASPDGTLVAAGDLNGGVAVWDVSGEKIQEVLKPQNYVLGDPNDIETPGSLHSLSFSPDGHLIFSGLHDGIIRSLNTTSGEVITDNLRLNAHVDKMAVSHDSRHLLTQQDNGSLTMWNIWSGTALYQLQGEIKNGEPFSQDDTSFAVASAGLSPSTVSIHNTANGEESYNLKSQPRIRSIQFVKNDSQLIVVYDGFIELWSMSSGQKLETKPEFDGTGCQTVKDINGQSVVSITQYQYVVMNNNNKRGLCVFSPLDWKVAIDEPGGRIVFGGESVLSIADARNPGNENQNLRGVNRKNIVSVAISPNGDLVAAAYDDHSIHIWDTATRDELTSAKDGLYGHSDTITDLRFTPDGKLLISVSMDGTIRLWGVPH